MAALRPAQMRDAEHQACATRTFFLPLLELEAARALASFDFCSFGACGRWAAGDGHGEGAARARGDAESRILQHRSSP